MKPQPEHMNDTYALPLLVPDYMYNKYQYVNFLSGAFQIMPWTTLGCLYSTALTIPYFPINDAFMGFAAEGCQYERVNEEHVHPGTKNSINVKCQIADSYEFSRLLGMIPLHQITPNHIAFHWSVAERKAVIHHIVSIQDGELDMRLPNRYYKNGETVYYCDSELTCNEVAL